MTPDQRRLARHALGLPNNSRKSYRNRFFATRAGGDWRVWREMTDAGLAEHEPAAPGKDLDFFCLTRKGADLALEPRERLCGEDFPPIGERKVAS